MEGEQIFKDYEQVKGYFKTIGVEYKFNCLYEKDPEGNYFERLSNLIV